MTIGAIIPAPVTLLPRQVSTLVIREANQGDLQRVGELGGISLLDGPYAGIIGDNPEQGQKCAEWVLANGKIIVAEESGQIIGMLGFVTTLHHMDGQPYSSELIWFVLPEHRKGGAAIKLLWEAEKKAKEMGAKSFVFTAPNEDVAALYKRFGYHKLEVTFRKTL